MTLITAERAGVTSRLNYCSNLVETFEMHDLGDNRHFDELSETSLRFEEDFYEDEPRLLTVRMAGSVAITSMVETA